MNNLNYVDWLLKNLQYIENVQSAMELEEETDGEMQGAATESRSPMIPSWPVALQKVFHFVLKVVPIMVNFVLCV